MAFVLLLRHRPRGVDFLDNDVLFSLHLHELFYAIHRLSGTEDAFGSLDLSEATHNQFSPYMEVLNNVPLRRSWDETHDLSVRAHVNGLLRTYAVLGYRSTWFASTTFCRRFYQDILDKKKKM